MYLLYRPGDGEEEWLRDLRERDLRECDLRECERDRDRGFEGALRGGWVLERTRH